VIGVRRPCDGFVPHMGGFPCVAFGAHVSLCMPVAMSCLTVYMCCSICAVLISVTWRGGYNWLALHAWYGILRWPAHDGGASHCLYAPWLRAWNPPYSDGVWCVAVCLHSRPRRFNCRYAVVRVCKCMDCVVLFHALTLMRGMGVLRYVSPTGTRAWCGCMVTCRTSAFKCLARSMHVPNCSSRTCLVHDAGWP